MRQRVLTRYKSLDERRFLAATAGATIGVLVTLLVVSLIADDGHQEQFEAATVLRVIDGDTVELTSGERVRYIGIDTSELFPETQCRAQEAAELNRYLVEGKEVELLPGPENRDRFGRLLRYVFAENVFVNAQLVREGLARARGFHRNERFRQVLVQLAIDAKTAGWGFWAECGW